MLRQLYFKSLQLLYFYQHCRTYSRCWDMIPSSSLYIYRVHNNSSNSFSSLALSQVISLSQVPSSEARWFGRSYDLGKRTKAVFTKDDSHNAELVHRNPNLSALDLGTVQNSSHPTAADNVPYTTDPSRKEKHSPQMSM